MCGYSLCTVSPQSVTRTALSVYLTLTLSPVTFTSYCSNVAHTV